MAYAAGVANAVDNASLVTADAHLTPAPASTVTWRGRCQAAITSGAINYGADRGKLIDIKQWGGAQWASMGGAFYGAENMRMSATDAPDLSAVGAMPDMFRDAVVFNGAIGTWNVGNVKDMAGMFGGAAAFNQDIGGWDVGNVIDMIDMFNGAAAFDQDIGGWDVGKVTDMDNMFSGAAAFSQNLGRWYIVVTPNTGYDGAADFVVLNLAAQNRFLTGQAPAYALAAGDGDDDNNKFTLTGAAHAELSANTDTAAGDYSVRIGAKRGGLRRR